MAGGAWKVAYADFVTAMMALFMVLWILGSEQDTLEQMQEYFKNPPSPWQNESNKYLIETGDFEGFSKDQEALEKFYNQKDPSILKGIMDTFQQMLQNQDMKVLPPVELSLTADELRMVLFDREDMSLFRGDTSSFTEWGGFMIQNIAWLLAHYNLAVTIEAHSRIDYKGNESNYGPWELSTDRANKVRRSLAYYADGDVEVKRVVGYGASKPLVDGESEHRKNQRTVISLSMPEVMTTEDFTKKRSIEKDIDDSYTEKDLLELDR